MTVRLHTTLRRRTEDGWQDRLTLALPAGATVATVVTHLDLPVDESVMIVVNRRTAGPDHPLADGDEVRFIPAVSGG